MAGRCGFLKAYVVPLASLHHSSAALHHPPVPPQLHPPSGSPPSSQAPPWPCVSSSEVMTSTVAAAVSPRSRARRTCGRGRRQGRIPAVQAAGPAWHALCAQRDTRCAPPSRVFLPAGAPGPFPAGRAAQSLPPSTPPRFPPPRPARWRPSLGAGGAGGRRPSGNQRYCPGAAAAAPSSPASRRRGHSAGWAQCS